MATDVASCYQLVQVVLSQVRNNFMTSNEESESTIHLYEVENYFNLSRLYL